MYHDYKFKEGAEWASLKNDENMNIGQLLVEMHFNPNTLQFREENMSIVDALLKSFRPWNIEPNGDQCDEMSWIHL